MAKNKATNWGDAVPGMDRRVTALLGDDLARHLTNVALSMDLGHPLGGEFPRVEEAAILRLYRDSVLDQLAPRYPEKDLPKTLASTIQEEPGYPGLMLSYTVADIHFQLLQHQRCGVKSAYGRVGVGRPGKLIKWGEDEYPTRAGGVLMWELRRWLGVGCLVPQDKPATARC